MKECKQCEYDKDLMSHINNCLHKWHTNYERDMCCLCGLDYEYLDK
jgi:hypothetical protein